MNKKPFYLFFLVLVSPVVLAAPSFSGYWALDSNVSDSSGNLLSGNATGVAALTAGSCKVGTCYEWDGAGSDFITLPASPFASKSVGTIGAWIYSDSMTSENWFGKDAAHFRSQLYANDTFFYQADNSIILGSSTVMSTGTWYHVMASWNGSRTWFYVNGVTSGNVSGSTTTDTGSGFLYLGQNSVNNADDWDGRMDEFFMINESINTSQASCIYNSGSGTDYAAAAECLNPTPPVPANQNFTINVTSTYDSSFLTTFTANVTLSNGTNTVYNTTSTNLITDIYSNASLTANITITADNYFSSTYNNWDVGTNLTANLTPYTLFNITDITDNGSISNLNVTFDNGTVYTITGSEYIPVTSDPYNISVAAPFYLNYTYTGLVQGAPVHQNIAQTIYNFSALEIITNNTVTNFTITYGGQVVTGDNPIIYFKPSTNAPSCTLVSFNFTKSGWYGSTKTLCVSSATNTTSEVRNVYQYLFNITAESFNGTSISNFTINISSGDYLYTDSDSTTNGSVFFPWTNDTNVNITISSDGYATTSSLANITSPTLTNVTVIVYTTNSIRFNFYDETTGVLLNGTEVTAYLTSSVHSTNISTTNGTYYVDLLMPAVYIITYSASGYTQREYVYSLENASSTELNLYLLNDTDDTIVLATVFDTIGRKVEGANIYMDKKNLSGTNYYTVETCTTNALGQCLLHVDLYETTYQFRIEYAGEFVFNSQDTKVSQTAISFTIVTSTNGLQIVYGLGYFEGILNYTNSSTTFTYVFDDVEEIFSSVCLSTTIRYDSSSQLNNTNCTTSSSGTLTLLINSSLGDEWIAKAYGVTSSSQIYELDSLSVVTSEFLQQFNRTGLYYFGFLLLGAMMFSGLIHPIIPPIMGGALVWVLNALGFIGVGTAAVGSLLAVVMIIVVINKRT